MRKAWLPLAGTAIAMAMAAQPASAKDIMVNMLTKGASGAYVFEPAMINAAVGDKVHFLPKDATHNAETIASILPAGVATSKGPMGKEFVLTVTKPGLYGVECLPHYSMGMVALVKVGTGASPNLAAAKTAKLPPLAAKRMTPLITKAG